MKCFECSCKNVSSDAVGVCSHCAAALCPEHVHVVDDPVTALQPVAHVVAFPRQARLLLCETCLEALSQRHSSEKISFDLQHT